MFLECPTKEKEPKVELQTRVTKKSASLECTNCVGTILLMDKDSLDLMGYKLLFSRLDFRVLDTKYPKQLLAWLIDNTFDAELIISNVDMHPMNWVDCLSMAKRSGGLEHSLQDVPVILYGESNAHIDTSFAAEYFPQKPKPEILLKTALAILHKFQKTREIKVRVRQTKERLI